MNCLLWPLYSVYVSTDYGEWRTLWNEISILMGQGIHTLMVGYSNYIDSPQDKRGERAFVDGVDSREFQEFIDKNGLVDLSFVGLVLFGIITIRVGRECGRGLV